MRWGERLKVSNGNWRSYLERAGRKKLRKTPRKIFLQGGRTEYRRKEKLATGRGGRFRRPNPKSLVIHEMVFVHNRGDGRLGTIQEKLKGEKSPVCQRYEGRKSVVRGSNLSGPGREGERHL